jgi:polysaccharide deacetylase 2 family uncharacterized protein YibQ
VVVLLGWLAAIATAPAGAAAAGKPLLAIIIDDLGNQRRLGMQAVELPGPVACAFMPHTPYAAELAERAHVNGKEVMLHLPMQPNEMQRIAGLGEISLDNQRGDLRRILASDLATVPHVVGINNHMGSLITRHPGHMAWLMDELAVRGNLFFVDSYTTAASVALATALERGVPAVRRHVFLDDDPAPAAVAEQFARLQQHARRRGFAVGIGHPYPATLAFLQSQLPELSAAGFELVSIQEILRRLERGELHQDAPAIPLASAGAGQLR